MTIHTWFQSLNIFSLKRNSVFWCPQKFRATSNFPRGHVHLHTIHSSSCRLAVKTTTNGVPRGHRVARVNTALSDTASRILSSIPQSWTTRLNSVAKKMEIWEGFAGQHSNNIECKLKSALNLPDFFHFCCDTFTFLGLSDRFQVFVQWTYLTN